MNTFDNIILPRDFRVVSLFYKFHSLSITLSLSNWWRLRMLQTTLDVLRPIANVLIGIEDQIDRAGHVMLALALAHIVHRAIILIRMIRYVIVFLVT